MAPEASPLPKDEGTPPVSDINGEFEEFFYN
jgi:hypothetical protein